MRLSWQFVILAMAVVAGLCSPPGAPGPPASEGLADDASLGPADQLPMEARDSELELEPAPAALVGPPAILNGGKPFFLDKDPVSGKLDFSATKVEPAGPPPHDSGKTNIKNILSK